MFVVARKRRATRLITRVLLTTVYTVRLPACLILSRRRRRRRLYTEQRERESPRCLSLVPMGTRDYIRAAAGASRLSSSSCLWNRYERE